MRGAAGRNPETRLWKELRKGGGLRKEASFRSGTGRTGASRRSGQDGRAEDVAEPKSRTSRGGKSWRGRKWSWRGELPGGGEYEFPELGSNRQEEVQRKGK